MTGSRTLSSKLLAGSFRNRSSSQSTPRRLTNQTTPSSSIGSGRSHRLDETIGIYVHSTLEYESNNSNISDGNPNDDIVVSKPTQKKFKVRQAVIADIDDNCIKEKTTAKSITLEGNKDHLETKKQIESLRKQYGDGWLHSQGATMVHSVLGIENERVEKPISSEEMIQSLLEETIGASVPKTADCLTSTPISSPHETQLNDSINSNVCAEVSNIELGFQVPLIYPFFLELLNLF